MSDIRILKLKSETDYPPPSSARRGSTIKIHVDYTLTSGGYVAIELWEPPNFNTKSSSNKTAIMIVGHGSTIFDLYISPSNTLGNNRLLPVVVHIDGLETFGEGVDINILSSGGTPPPEKESNIWLREVRSNG